MKCFQILWLILRLADNLIRFKETNETCRQQSMDWKTVDSFHYRHGRYQNREKERDRQQT